MNPSWQVTKLIEATGRRPDDSYRSLTPGQPGGELRQGGRLAAPVVAHRVPVLAVPFCPQRREVADLVAALADVPRLGDQLHLGHHRVLLDEVEERGQPVHVVQLAREGRGQVEPEPVDVHLEHPVPQRVHDQLQRVRVPHVQAVAAARVVDVAPLVPDVEPVVRLVVDAAEAERRTAVVALGGVVVNHVEDDLDARRVQRPDHGLELADLLAPLAGAGVPVVRREEADRVVAPVVGQVALDQRLLGEELVHRQQLHRGDPDPAQVLDHRRVAHPRVGAPLGQRDLRVAQRQAADVRLVDHRLVVRDARRPVVAPVEERVDDDVLRHERRAVGRVPPPRVAPLIVKQRLVPGQVALDGLGVGVEQQLGRGAAGAALGSNGPCTR